MKTYLLPAVRLLLVLTLVTGIAYPLAMTLAASVLFPHHADGSVIERRGAAVGSSLIAQKFTSAIYFHPRPSAIDYNPLPSSGTNFGPTSKALQDSLAAHRTQFIAENGMGTAVPVPREMLFASASGLDPHISPGAAVLQIARVAHARGFDAGRTRDLTALVDRSIERPEFGFLGQPRINVLLLNIALDELAGR